MVQVRAKLCREEYEIHIASSRITVAQDRFGIQWYCQGFRRTMLLWHWYVAVEFITGPTTAFEGRQGVSKLADAKQDWRFTMSDCVPSSPLTQSFFEIKIQRIFVLLQALWGLVKVPLTCLLSKNPNNLLNENSS